MADAGEIVMKLWACSLSSLWEATPISLLPLLLLCHNGAPLFIHAMIAQSLHFIQSMIQAVLVAALVSWYTPKLPRLPAQAMVRPHGCARTSFRIGPELQTSASDYLYLVLIPNPSFDLAMISSL